MEIVETAAVFRGEKKSNACRQKALSVGSSKEPSLALAKKRERGGLPRKGEGAAHF